MHRLLQLSHMHRASTQLCARLHAALLLLHFYAMHLRVPDPCLQDPLSAKDTTKRVALAGAIAARARESKTVYLEAKGADAVANAISAVCYARQYLEVRPELCIHQVFEDCCMLVRAMQCNH